jgi:hypothetical protein
MNFVSIRGAPALVLALALASLGSIATPAAGAQQPARGAPVRLDCAPYG